MIANTIVPVSMVHDAMKLLQDTNVYYIGLHQVVFLAFHSFDHSTLVHWEAGKSLILFLFHLHMFEYTVRKTETFINASALRWVSI